MLRPDNLDDLIAHFKNDTAPRSFRFPILREV